MFLGMIAMSFYCLLPFLALIGFIYVLNHYTDND